MSLSRGWWFGYWTGTVARALNRVFYGYWVRLVFWILDRVWYVTLSTQRCEEFGRGQWFFAAALEVLLIYSRAVKGLYIGLKAFRRGVGFYDG